MIKEIKGDITTFSEWNVIAHCANCQKTMGSGVAKAIRAKYPDAYKADVIGKSVLGGLTAVNVYNNRFIVNMYGQDLFGGGRELNYEAIYTALDSTFMLFQHQTIGIPKLMGCALAGGDWDIVYTMIEKFAGIYGTDVVIVDFN